MLGTLEVVSGRKHREGGSEAQISKELNTITSQNINETYTTTHRTYTITASFLPISIAQTVYAFDSFTGFEQLVYYHHFTLSTSSPLLTKVAWLSVDRTVHRGSQRPVCVEFVGREIDGQVESIGTGHLGTVRCSRSGEVRIPIGDRVVAG